MRKPIVKENDDWRMLLVGAAVVAVLALAPAVFARSAPATAGVSPTADVHSSGFVGGAT